MGSGFSHLIPCLRPDNNTAAATTATHDNNNDQDEVIFTTDQPLDETLGHSFCYVRSSARFLSPTPSDRFISPTQSLRFSPPHDNRSDTKPRSTAHETGFRTISGASVSANTSTPRTFVQLDNGVYDDCYSSSTTDFTHTTSVRGLGSIVNGFESTSLFSALPLQPAPRGEQSGPIERGGFFLSGPIERGAISCPLDSSALCDGGGGGVPYSAPLGGGSSIYAKTKNRRKKSLAGIKRAFNRSMSEKKRPWVVPVRNVVGRKEVSGGADLAGESGGGGAAALASMMSSENDVNVQWALGKAGEDRVHVVISEENGWLFVGIYDGFNGPDAPEFLMSHLYRAVFNELKGLFWDNEQQGSSNNDNINTTTTNNQTGQPATVNIDSAGISSSGEATAAVVEHLDTSVSGGEISASNEISIQSSNDLHQDIPISSKKVTFQSEKKKESRRKLWEYLAEDDPQDGLDLSGSQRFAFSVDDAVSIGNEEGSAANRRSLLLSKLKQGLSRNKDGISKGLFHWRFGTEEKEKVDETENKVEERAPRSGMRRKSGPVDHGLVLRALSQALEKTELAYLDLTDKVIDQYPELALMGSCLLVVLMRDEDVYVMNLGDSRAIVAQLEPLECASSNMDLKVNVESASSNVDLEANGDNESSKEVIVVENPSMASNGSSMLAREVPDQDMKLVALQLSTDHSTSIEEEVLRIKREHPDDTHCIVNDRVKGRLKVTRAFGAGFLKQAKWNAFLLERFRNEFFGSTPYVSCIPSVCHYKIGSRDQFLVLSSDGLYQYLSNQEVVSHVANFLEVNQDGDPAQHLIEELLSRAAKKAGMGFHDLLDIPHGEDRRKYHDDVTVMVISLEGRIWKSSGKYP